MSFETDRLIIRAPDPSTDIPHLLSMKNPLSTQLLLDNTPPKPYSHALVSDQLSASSSRFFYAILVLKSDPSEFVGTIGLDHVNGPVAGAKNRDVMLSITLVSESRGKGYGKEAITWVIDWAFRMAGMHRVTLMVFEGNDNAIKLYRKLGFVEEVVKRKCNWVNGEWKDITTMGLLCDEWEANRQVKQG